MTRFVFFVAMVVAAGLAPGQAWAHAGSSEASLASVLLHPLTGIDHVLAALGVGLYAAWLGRRAAWTLPLTFAASVAAGVGLAALPWHLPVNHAAATAAVLGAVLFLAFARLGPALAVPALALAALVHGHAHGDLAAGGPAIAGATAWGLTMAGVGLARLTEAAVRRTRPWKPSGEAENV